MAKPKTPASRARRTVAVPSVPYGRSLRDFPRRSPAEVLLLACCKRGEVAVVSPERPEEETKDNRVRAGLVRFLVLGGDTAAPVHERGVRLQGAWVTGALDLEVVKAERRLTLYKCNVDQVIARQANLAALNLTGSRLRNGLTADRLRCDGSVFLRDCHVSGEIRLIGAKIGSNLDCRGANFNNNGKIALGFDGAYVTGDVFLRNGFSTNGEVRLLGATIIGDLDCGDATFNNEDERALIFDNAKISGNVFLNRGFKAAGEVRLLNATIEGSLHCTNGSFECPKGDALSSEHVRVSGAFFFRGLKKLDGGVLLTSMQVGSLCDDPESWAGADGRLTLDGFTYDRLVGSAPTDAKSRIEWLNRQLPIHLNGEFRPQPWEQLVSVLRRMGHPEAARSVAIAKHEKMHDVGRYVGGSYLWDLTYGGLISYGYRPWKLVKITLAVWAVCAVIYLGAVHPRCLGLDTYLLAPPASEPSPSCLIERAARRDLTPCPTRAPNYAEFFTPAYSAEVLLPVISLGYKNDWEPVVSTPDGRPLVLGWALLLVYWFENLFGWFAGLLLISAMRNLIKRD